MLQQRLTAQDILGLDNVSDAQISPDGRHVAFVRRIRDLSQGRSSHRIWIHEVRSGTQDPVTDPKSTCISPRWSPDGSCLSWLDVTGGNTQLCLRGVASETAEGRTVDLPAGSYGIAWSPSADRIAFLAPSEIDGESTGTAGVTVVEPEGGQIDLCLLRLSDRSVTRITQGRFAITDLAWHPDEGSLAVCAVPSTDPADWDSGDVWRIRLDGHEPERLLAGRCTRAVWSPEGDRLAVVRLGTRSFLDTPTLDLIDLDGEARAVDPFDEEFQLLSWTPGGLLALSIDGPSSHLYRIDPETADPTRLMPNAPEGFTLIEGWFGQGCTLSEDGAKMAFTFHDIEHPGEAAILDLRTGQLDVLTDLLSPYRSWDLPTPERFSWSTSDGTLLSGVLIKPPLHQAGTQRQPLIVALHGGPTAMASLAPFADNDWIWAAIPLMLQRGAMILLPDYRGSAGYGSAFRQMNERRVGLVNLEDIGAAIDALDEKGWIDRDRVGAVGASHGGFLAALLATATDRLAAAVCRSGITDWTLNFELNQNPDWECQYFGGAPWECPEEYRASSPVAYLDRANTPVLLLHGTEDRQAPTANAHALHRGLTHRGTPSRLVLFEGAGHGGGSLRQLQQGIEETVRWFETWLELS